MPAEHRCAVVAAAGTQAADLAAVLPQPTPQRGLACGSQRMSAHADNPITAASPHLGGLEEEVDTLTGPAIGAVAVPQAPRAAEDLRQMA